MSLPDVKDIHGFDLSDRAKHSWYLAMAVSLVLERTIQTSKEEVAELKEALSFIKPAARGVESVHSRIDHKHFKVDNDYELTFEEATREYYDRLNTQGGHIHAKLLDANRTIAELDKPMRQLHEDLIAFANSPKDRQRELMEQDLAEVVARNHEILSIIHNLKHPLGLRASSLAVRFAETRGEKSEVLGPPSWQQKRQVEDHPLQEPERDLKLDGPYGQKLYQIPHNKKADFLSNRLTYMDNQLSYLSEAISERPQDETTKQTMNTINERARNIQDLRTRIEDALRTNMNDQVILLSMVESDMEKQFEEIRSHSQIVVNAKVSRDYAARQVQQDQVIKDQQADPVSTDKVVQSTSQTEDNYVVKKYERHGIAAMRGLIKMCSNLEDSGPLDIDAYVYFLQEIDEIHKTLGPLSRIDRIKQLTDYIGLLPRLLEAGESPNMLQLLSFYDMLHHEVFHPEAEMTVLKEHMRGRLDEEFKSIKIHGATAVLRSAFDVAPSPTSQDHEAKTMHFLGRCRVPDLKHGPNTADMPAPPSRTSSTSTEKHDARDYVGLDSRGLEG